jgi:hypothetical protein
VWNMMKDIFFIMYNREPLRGSFGYNTSIPR